MREVLWEAVALVAYLALVLWLVFSLGESRMQLSRERAHVAVEAYIQASSDVDGESYDD